MAEMTSKSVVDETATVDTAVADNQMAENTTKKVTKKTAAKKATVTKTVEVEPLDDSDEIEVVSLIPNVSYKDKKTEDFYEWDEVGHSEYLSYETLKNMWRNHKGYFRKMWLKPMDDRVIQKFGLTKMYEEYEFLIDESNYTKANINKICSKISSAPNAMKHSFVTKIKDMVISGEVSDVSVIRAIENHLHIDLISLL